MTPYRERACAILHWVAATHGPDWHFSVTRKGEIQGRRRVGRHKREHKLLGTVEEALAAVKEEGK